MIAGKIAVTKFLSLLIFGLIIFSCAGCIYDDEPLPVIVEDYKLSGYDNFNSAKPAIPAIVKPNQYVVPNQWLVPHSRARKWNAIILHHSATGYGNSEIFDVWHKQRHWDGVGYNFVIGNGTDSADGQVEVTFRWIQQRTGAHCGGTAKNWANEKAIGICLVGDFNKTSPTSRQMRSLIKLVKFLQKRYGIPANRIYGHGTTPGARSTECPGRNFPMYRFKQLLR